MLAAKACWRGRGCGCQSLRAEGAAGQATGWQRRALGERDVINMIGDRAQRFGPLRQIVVIASVILEGTRQALRLVS